MDSEGQSDSTGESAARTWMVQRFAVLTKSIFGSMQTRLAEINLGHDIIEIFKVLFWGEMRFLEMRLRN